LDRFALSVPRDIGGQPEAIKMATPSGCHLPTVGP
jgi:hypothetical protein